MKQIILTFCIIFSATAAFAAPSAPRGFLEGAMHAVDAPVKPSRLSGACVDFSGTWMGQCEPNKNKVELTIQQSGCEGVSIDNQFILFGGSRITHMMNQEFVSVGTVLAQWNENSTEASFRLLGSMNSAVGQGHTYTTLERMRLEKGVLVVSSEGEGKTLECRLSKK